MYIPQELSPLDVVMLEVMLEPKFCDREAYDPEMCARYDPHCTICKDLLIQKGGTA
jgi:hypothetical protein